MNCETDNRWHENCKSLIGININIAMDHLSHSKYGVFSCVSDGTQSELRSGALLV